MKSCRAALLCLLLPAMSLAQSAAEPEVRVSASPYRLPPPLLHAQITLVPLEVVVRRADGSLVAGLTRQDFAVFDDGQPRALAAFSVQQRAAASPALGSVPIN